MAIQTIKLPDPWFASEVSIEEAMLARRSNRRYENLPLQLNQLGQICWAAQGVTNHRGFRTAPSAGALYPLEIYIVSGNVNSIDAGVYHYISPKHELVLMLSGDMREDLTRAALNQKSIRSAPAGIVIGAVYERTMRKYQRRGIRYVHMEAGHAAQNIYLQTVSLGLKTVVIGAFSDVRVADVLDLDDGIDPLYIMPVGR